LVAGRYRIIALLGRGGMGEVYRADDLTLGQPVALKFLPDEAAGNEGLLERFHSEVRIARRVSHPNVCRVYDVGEVSGQSFFTMEYVDGEDLASLLRRIGRLPSDKALDIARQLCAGLAAAHAKGVLHRDLKPANIMLDGRGQAVITDFGLAGVAGQIEGAEVRSGTPAYMSPEQLAGKEVSVRSDIYALGLVLYEIFTGRRAVAEPAGSPRRVRDGSAISRPSSVVKELDPAVERAIMRCLEVDPAARPASVLSVATALPGGDPLAAALAAGETPSPEMVAAAGATVGLPVRTAVLCLAAVVVGLAIAVYLNIRSSAFEKMGLDRSPEVLEQRAREIVAQLGYEKRPVDSAYSMYSNGDVSDYLERAKRSRAEWDEILAGRSSLVQFWYRQSPEYMSPTQFHDLSLTPGLIQQNDPPEIVSGMVRVELDPQGRLIYFQAMPPQLETTHVSAAPPPDWNQLFKLADLDPAQLQPTEPLWTTLATSDSRLAWKGTWPETTRPLRVEAASFQGKPVFFALIGEWTKPERSGGDTRTRGEKTRDVSAMLLLLGILAGAAALARRNYRMGRADREGALRLGLIMFVLEIMLWLFRGHLVPGLETFFFLLVALSTGLLVACVTWLLYLAVEPWVRRTWPETIITWSRLLSGQLRDALVGRDLLFGVMLGVVWILVFNARDMFLIHAGGAPRLFNSYFLTGGRQALGTWLSVVPGSIIGALEFFFVLLGLKILLRKDWIAAVAYVAIFSALHAAGPHANVVVPTFVLVYCIAVLIVYRYGLIPLAVAIFAINLLGNVPFSADFSTWYMTTSLFALGSVLAIAAWGFYQALGGKPIWKEDLG
jgi:Protein kinase domain